MSVKDKFSQMLRNKDQQVPDHEFTEEAVGIFEDDDESETMHQNPRYQEEDAKALRKQKIKDNLKGVVFAAGISCVVGAGLWSAMSVMGNSDPEVMVEASEPVKRSLDQALAQANPDAQNVEQNKPDFMVNNPELKADNKLHTPPSLQSSGLPSLNSQDNSFISSVKEKFKAKGLVVNDVRIIGELAEVTVGKKVVYMTKDGYAMEGNLIDFANDKNLTHERLADLMHVDAKIFNKTNAINIGFGAKSKEVHVFLDPSCPKCMSLFRDLSRGDFNVYIYPITLPGFAKSERLNTHAWCAGEKSNDVYHRMMMDDQFRSTLSNTKAPACKTPFADNMTLMQKQDINSAPAAYDMNGKFIPSII